MLSNQVTVTPNEGDSDLSDNEHSIRQPVQAGVEMEDASADISLTVGHHAAETVQPGARVDFQVTVRNAGPISATNIVVDASWTNAAVKSVKGGCSSFPCTISELAAGADATLDVSAVVGSHGKFEAQFRASGVEHDPTPGNNAAIVRGEVPDADGTPRADLSVTPGQSQNERGYPSEMATFYFVVENNGPAPASHVKFDHFASGIRVDNVGGDGEPSNCEVPVGSSITVHVNATHESPGEFSGQLQVIAAQTDPDPDNNIAWLGGRTKARIPWLWITGVLALLAAGAAGAQVIRKRHWRKLVEVRPSFDRDDITSPVIAEMPGPPVEVNSWVEFGDAAPTTPIRVTHEEF